MTHELWPFSQSSSGRVAASDWGCSAHGEGSEPPRDALQANVTVSRGRGSSCLSLTHTLKPTLVGPPPPLVRGPQGRGWSG